MKGVIFCRVSSQSDRQNNDRQKFILNNYANCNNIEIVKEFSEKISGATINTQRNILNDCLIFCKENNVDIILFAELSRLGRKTLEVLENIKWLTDNKINAHFLKENITLLDNDGNILPTTTIMITCLNFGYEQELYSLKTRLCTGRELAKSRGVKMGRKIGYRKSKEEKKEQYKEVLKLLHKGRTIKEVHAICKENGKEVSERTIWSLKKEFCPKKDD